MDSRLFHRKYSLKTQEIDDVLDTYHIAVRSGASEDTQHHHKENALKLINEILYTSTPFPELSFLIELFGKLHSSLSFGDDDMLSQWHWMKLLTCFSTSFITTRTAEQYINECREYVKKAPNDYTRAMACLLISSFARCLDIRNQQFITQLTIIIKNLKATLLDSLQHTRYMALSHLVCTSSIVDLSLYWFERLEKASPHTPPPTPFVEIVFKVLFHVLLNARPPYPIPQSSIPLHVLIPQVTAEGLKSLIQQQRMWASLPSVATVDILRCSLLMLKRFTKLDTYSSDEPYQQGLHSPIVEEGSLAYILQVLGTSAVFETILSLPNLLSELLSGLLHLLVLYPYSLLDLRLQAICIIITFLSTPDCIESGIHSRGIDWDNLFSNGCTEDLQLSSLCEIVATAFGAYADANGIANRAKQVVIPYKFSQPLQDDGAPKPLYP